MGFRLMVSKLYAKVALNFLKAVAILLLIFKNATGLLQNSPLQFFLQQGKMQQGCCKIARCIFFATG